MKMFSKGDLRHRSRALGAALLCSLALLGCSSAPTGHAPGVAGGESLTPGVTNFPLAYIKRPVPTGDIDVRDLITSTTGGDLYVRAQASAGGQEANVTSSITMGKGDVRDVDVSPDGTKLVFSLRLPLNPALQNTDPKQPNWHIYQYDASTKAVTQLTNDDITAGHDVGAHYLADGRIVFSSTRQLATQAILLDEGRPQYPAQTDNRQQSIFLLHVMNADGTNMQQISFNTNHDFDPSLLANGQIVFSRWEVVDGTDQISLFTSNVDGTGEQLLYGANSHATGANAAGTNNNVIQFLNARQRADGKMIVIDRPFANTQLGGDILLIDTADFVNINQPSSPPGTASVSNTTTTSTSGTTGSTTPTATGQASATTLGVTTDQSLPSLGGRFYSAYPLYDGTNRMLVSWSPCLVMISNTTQICTNANTAGANVTLAPPQYTLWVYDFDAGTLSPLLGATAGMMVVEPVVMQSRAPVPAFPVVTTPTAAQQSMAAAQVGLLNIGSVYDFDGVDTATPNIAAVSNPGNDAFYSRQARFIRIEKAVEIPATTVRKIDPNDFGPTGMGMREILGYAPIQPDGSVQIQVPANVPFTIDILDGNARRISAQHNSWLQLIPGEIKTCNGCHSSANDTSHGRAGLTVAANAGAASTGVPFPDTYPAITPVAGETMAQTLGRLTCGVNPALALSTGCTQTLSSDVIYNTTWTVNVTLPPNEIDRPISYTYAALNESPPTNSSCTPWTAQCRIIIHYANAASMSQSFLQQMWNLTTRMGTLDNVTASVTCTNCHTSLSAQSVLQVPAGQLDLTGTKFTSSDPTILNSYEELLFQHDEQTLNMGLLVNVMVPGPGGTTVPVPLASVMAAGSAIASQPNFLSKFDGVDHGVTVDHTGYLSPAELRLISEWLDIGAQYYNDPFVAPAVN